MVNDAVHSPDNAEGSTNGIDVQPAVVPGSDGNSQESRCNAPARRRCGSATCRRGSGGTCGRSNDAASTPTG